MIPVSALQLNLKISKLAHGKSDGEKMEMISKTVEDGNY